MENIDKQKLLYQILEVQYIKSFGYSVNINDMEYKKLYPYSWFFNENYLEKIEILVEAIDKKIKIVDTDSYQKSIKDKIL